MKLEKILFYCLAGVFVVTMVGVVLVIGQGFEALFK